MNESAAFLALLRRDGVVHTSDARLTPLSGGVSCEVYLVQDGVEQFVAKRALAKLKVKADWRADIGRNRHEWEYIRYVTRFLPDAVPVLRHCSATDHYFTMEYLNGRFLNWKQLLLAGQAEVAHARHTGNVLAQIHRYSAGDAEAMRLFDTTPFFSQLRIEPFLLTTGAKHPALRPLFAAEAARLAAARECLVHGDFSPKNLLINGDHLVVLDCEVAWYGDPAFDLAFLMNHLCLKALRHAPTEVGVRPMPGEFWSAYQAARPSPEIELRVGRLLLMLMLARVDGKSPVEYLDATRQQFVREFVREQLPAGNFSLHDIADAWFRRLAQFKS
jgi:aminoglycoside phosphotransferase (APT) family kinase protein